MTFVSLSNLKKKVFIQAQRIVPQQQLSRVVGKVAASENPIVKNIVIQAFKAQYGIDMSIAEQSDALKFKSFNEFFTRSLKEGVRQIDQNESSIVSPADGAISQIGHIDEGDIFQAKGQSFSVDKLIGDPQLAAPFKNGEFATVYLSPKDYHRVHMPFAGTLTETLYIPGELFSVNQTTAENIPGLFARNERMVCLFDTEIGRMAVVLVGAMIVAGIETVATGKVKPTGRLELNHHQLDLEKGDELGRFYLGSTAVVLFEPNKINWDVQFKANSTVVMGEALGHTI
ncbi:phosphatidylserine decarboxylase [Acinetobacter shaoyimingii]|uniref:Phosphatidylserine decarboxylase proenzyme n=1 Tax=Acinetobacter shaoyimingii TaxID=2715164 RepID=A0A6G8S0D6_9GAMM|nr:archaetidylserine decarboxylase [Acinetobacter shaoyimingii]QIO07560.1 phosphatidylserine decarboxylase [Acinetobacter shaoyimingii]